MRVKKSFFAFKKRPAFVVASPLVMKVKTKDMSTFAIYAFVITGLYIFYMAVAILMDLFGKKGQKKDSTEVFNNADMGGDDEEEHSTVVDETDDGYAVHHPSEENLLPPADEEQVEDEETAVYDEGDGADQEEQPVDTNPDDEDLLEQESMESKAAYESLKAVQESMDTVQPSYQEEFRSEEYAFVMAQPISQRSKMLKKIIERV